MSVRDKRRSKDMNKKAHKMMAKSFKGMNPRSAAALLKGRRAWAKRRGFT